MDNQSGGSLEQIQTGGAKVSFFHHMFHLKKAEKCELYNVIQADSIGCHIITATNNILKKLPTIGKDLTQFSLETVKMFRNDAIEASYQL